MRVAFTAVWVLLVCLSVLSPDTYADDTFMAAAASMDVTPPVGVPLGGYGAGKRRLKFPWGLFHHYKYATIFAPSEGIHDPIRAKVLLLKNGDRKLVFVSLDVVGVSEEVYKDFVKRMAAIGYSQDEVFISATHTHSGPGTLSANLMWEVAVQDFFQREVYEQVIGGAIAAVMKAEAALEPADLLSMSFDAKDLQANRRNHPGVFDPQANLLLARSKTGAWLGGLTNIAIHGTAFDKNNLLYSADVPGAIERGLEGKFSAMNQLEGLDKPATFVFFNGPEGDVAPKYGQEAGIQLIGDSFAEQTMTALPTAQAVQPDWRVFSQRIDLGDPSLNLGVCGTKTPILKAMSLGLGAFIPHKPRFSFIRLGGLMMVTWPGEPTTNLGLALKEAFARSVPPQNFWLLSLTNGYVAYFTTPTEYFEGGYESCSSVFGPQAGEKIVNQLIGTFSSSWE